MSGLHLAVQGRQVPSCRWTAKTPGIDPEQLLLGAPQTVSSQSEQEACTYKEVFGVSSAVGASKATHDMEGQMGVS